MALPKETTEALLELEQGVYSALETYSNVHRGSGHNSMVTTHLYEQARDIILEHFGLKKGKYVVIFLTPRRTEKLVKKITKGSYQIVSSHEIGLPLGVSALIIKKKNLPGGIPFQTGGGTTNLISKDWVIWAKAPDKFEAGTPAIMNVIAFAKALLLLKKYGNNIFKEANAEKISISKILTHDELEEYSGQELLDKLKKTLIGRDIKVPTTQGMRHFINLDNSASTPTFTPIWNTFRQILSQSKQAQQEIIQEVKSICASMLGAPLTSYDMIFTSNATEAINLAAENLSLEFDKDTEPVILNTLLEHSSNELPWRKIPNHSLIRLSVSEEGFIDLKELETTLIKYNCEAQFGKKRIKLVAISGASNVLGICNNLEEISRITHKYKAQLLVDAAQLVAHRKIDIEAYGIDYLAFSAHKVYAPFGCGVLIARKGFLKFNTAELESIRSSGEENAGGIAALGKAFVLLQRIGMEVVQKEEQALTVRAMHEMKQIPMLKIHGMKSPDHPEFNQKLGVVLFEMKGMMADRVAKELAIQGGIGVRYGCHCAHIIIKHLLNVGPGLEQFQRLIVTLFPNVKLPGLTRVSFGLENGEKDVDNLIQALHTIIRNQKDTSSSKENIEPALPKSEVKKQMEDFVKDSAMKVYSCNF